MQNTVQDSIQIEFRRQTPAQVGQGAGQTAAARKVTNISREITPSVILSPRTVLSPRVVPTMSNAISQRVQVQQHQQQRPHFFPPTQSNKPHSSPSEFTTTVVAKQKPSPTSVMNMTKPPMNRSPLAINTSVRASPLNQVSRTGENQKKKASPVFPNTTPPKLGAIISPVYRQASQQVGSSQSKNSTNVSFGSFNQVRNPNRVFRQLSGGRPVKVTNVQNLAFSSFSNHTTPSDDAGPALRKVI